MSEWKRTNLGPWVKETEFFKFYISDFPVVEATIRRNPIGKLHLSRIFSTDEWQHPLQAAKNWCDHATDIDVEILEIVANRKVSEK